MTKIRRMVGIRCNGEFYLFRVSGLAGVYREKFVLLGFQGSQVFAGIAGKKEDRV
jgi:hypothetical protein